MRNNETLPGTDSTAESATEGIVSVSHPLAARVGKDILEKGGNAVDATVAIQFSLNVVEPYMSGIGGGGYMLIYDAANDKITSLDGRETAPKNIDYDFYTKKEKNRISHSHTKSSGKSAAVPGILKQIEYALHKYGTMALSELLEPAIKQAEDGITVNWATEKYTRNAAESLRKHHTSKQIFVPSNTPLKEGDRLVQKNLAKTLTIIKKEGAEALYNGEIGEAFVAEVQRNGGTITMDDLKNYTVEEKTPVRAKYRDYEIASMGLSSSGGLTLIQILKLMESVNVEEKGPLSVDYLHYLIESMHLAYADRAEYMGDENFVWVPKETLIDENYITSRSQGLNPHKSRSYVEPGKIQEGENKQKSVVKTNHNRAEEPNETTHFSVVDKWGNMVSFTTSIGAVYGTGMTVPDYGFLLSNTGGVYSEEGLNKPRPGKRGLSSMTPTIMLENKKPFMAIGSPGAITIIASVAQTIINMVDFNMPVQQAVVTPRIFSSTSSSVQWEKSIPQDTILQLMAKGHNFDEVPADHIGDVHAVIFDRANNKMYGGTDNTREGTVIGVDNVYFKMDNPEKAPEAEKEETPFTLKVDGVVYPFYASQMTFVDDTCYIQKDKLFLGFGIKDPEYYADDMKYFKGAPFAPVKAIGESLGFNVQWDESSKVMFLESSTPKPVNEKLRQYYKEVEKNITR